MFPAFIDKSLVQPVVSAMHGIEVDVTLKIWHGFNVVLLLSVITLAAGTAMYIFIKPKEESLLWMNRFHSLSPQQIFNRVANAVKSFARWFTDVFQNGYLRTYVLIIVVFLITLLSYKLFTGVNIYIDSGAMHEITSYEATIVGIMLIAIFKTVFTLSRLVAVVAMGVVGYCLCLLFVFYSAPDLAMTQFTIDTLTVVLFVLILFRLPSFIKTRNYPRQVRDGLVALSLGTLLSIIAMEVLNESVTKETSRYYAENAYVLAKGKNVVNVILVDFRGMDTIVEIIVLTIAAIGVYSMLKLKIGQEVKE
jgi:multicomponent Na+:H+ antiporter subunit A